MTFKDGLINLTKNGYRVLSTNSEEYAFIITPDDNVLCAYVEYFGGYNFSLQYVPTRQNGTGCQCLEKPIFEITPEIVADAEKQGLQFAYRLKAPLYKTSDQWYKSYWNKDKLTEVK